MTVLTLKRRVLKYVLASFRRETDLSSWLWRYAFLTRLPSQDPVSHPDTRRRYLVTLLETRPPEAASRVLTRYLQRGGAWSSFEPYLRLAEFAVSHGCADPAVRSAAQLSARLRACHATHTFARFVDGKTVALVGNGPQEVGKGSGREIDAHDLVIRINN